MLIHKILKQSAALRMNVDFMLIGEQTDACLQTKAEGDLRFISHLQCFHNFLRHFMVLHETECSLVSSLKFES